MKKILLIFVSAFCLILPWSSSFFIWFCFLSIAPLLLLLQFNTTFSKINLITTCFVSILLWNLFATFFIFTASKYAYILSIFLNSILQTIPFFLLIYVIPKRKKIIKYVLFIVCWCSIEYLQHTWNIGLPWLSYGNVFLANTKFIQWYEYTGIAGGTYWVLCSNVLVCVVIELFILNNKRAYLIITLVSLLLFIGIPIIFSLHLKNSTKKNAEQRFLNVVLVQPCFKNNNSPMYKDVHSNMENILLLTKNNIDDSTDLVIWPEGAMQIPIVNDSISKNSVYSAIFSFLGLHKRLSILSGVNSFYYTDNYKQNNVGVLKIYNSSILLSNNISSQVRHKKKLVPGAEFIPAYLKFIENYFEKFYSFNSTYSTDTIRYLPFILPANKKISCVICFESLFGSVVAAQVLEGASAVIVITNDSWFDGTTAKERHLQFSCLRAIETRKFVSQVGMNGITAVINTKGEIVKMATEYNQYIIKYKVPLNQDLTFYSKHDDYLYQVSLICFLLLLFNYSLVKGIRFVYRKKRYSRSIRNTLFFFIHNTSKNGLLDILI